jgi:hypothetical protein
LASLKGIAYETNTWHRRFSPGYSRFRGVGCSQISDPGRAGNDLPDLPRHNQESPAETARRTLQPNKWKRDQDIFAIRHGREDYFPLYALNPDDHRPRKQMAEILRIFGDAKDGWGLAFWFAALNSFLDDERPQDVLAIDPDRVIAAAKDEMAGVQHG